MRGRGVESVFTHYFYAYFWQISKYSVLDSESPKRLPFFQTAGKTQFPKRLIIGKDHAAGKVLAEKSIIFAFCGVVGSKRRTPARSRVVKTRMTEEEYAGFAERLSVCNMSQAEFIRQALSQAGSFDEFSSLLMWEGATDTAADKMMKVLEAEAGTQKTAI